jgi:hypothetical protein
MTGGGGGGANWRAWLLAALTGVFALAAILVPAMPQPLSYHEFADCRTIWAIPNFFNVLFLRRIKRTDIQRNFFLSHIG